jgi:hypothetical protein
MEVTHLPDGECLLLLVRSLQKLPSLLGRYVTGDVVQSEETVGLAVGSDVALGLADTTDLRSLVLPQPRHSPENSRSTRSLVQSEALWPGSLQL